MKFLSISADLIRHHQWNIDPLYVIKTLNSRVLRLALYIIHYFLAYEEEKRHDIAHLKKHVKVLLKTNVRSNTVIDYCINSIPWSNLHNHDPFPNTLRIISCLIERRGSDVGPGGRWSVPKSGRTRNPSHSARWRGWSRYDGLSLIEIILFSFTIDLLVNEITPFFGFVPKWQVHAITTWRVVMNSHK